MDGLSNKHSKKRKPINSIDGISHGQQKSSSLRETRKIGKPAPHQLKARRRIDDFKHTENFRPADSNSLGTPLTKNALANQKTPIYKTGSRANYRGSSGNVELDGAQRQRKGKKGKLFKSFSVLVLLILIGGGGLLFTKGQSNLGKIFGGGSGGAAALKQDIDPSSLHSEGDGRINVLVAGRGGASHEAPDLTDTIILASIDPFAEEAALISIPRDFYVDVPDYGSMKINEVFYNGKFNYLSTNPGDGEENIKKAEEAGLNLLDDTVSEVLGIPVHYHGVVDFTGFKKAVDTIGGVNVDVPSPVRENMRINGEQYQLNVKKGEQHFDGFEALAYARSRYTSPRGDFDRAQRQRLIVLALKEKIFEAGTYSNPLKVTGLLDDLGDHIKTNFDVEDIDRMYQISSAINEGKVISVGLVDPPNNFVTTDTIGNLSVVLPNAGLGDYSEIHNYIRNTVRDSFIRQENPAITVLNGTENIGAAAEKANELKSYGYNVIKVDNAPSRNYNRNILVDMRNGEDKYSKRYLELRTGVDATSSLPDASIDTSNADFVIIVGE